MPDIADFAFTLRVFVAIGLVGLAGVARDHTTSLIKTGNRVVDIPDKGEFVFVVRIAL